MKHEHKSYGFIVKFRKLDSGRARRVTKAIHVDGCIFVVNARGELFTDNHRLTQFRWVEAARLREHHANALVSLGVLNEDDLEEFRRRKEALRAATNEKSARHLLDRLERYSGVEFPKRLASRVVAGVKANPEDISPWL